MYIYLARSIRGDRATDTSFVQELKRFIEKLGHHTQFDIPIKVRRTLSESQNEYIYARDLAWIDQCQAMIAEVTYPSHGVGYEIAYAKHVWKMDVFCVAQKDTNVSAMIAGDLKVFGYRDLSDLCAYLETCLEGMNEHNS